MLEKKYYDGMQIHDVLCECLDDYDTILTILEKFASLPSATKADRKTEPIQIIIPKNHGRKQAFAMIDEIYAMADCKTENSSEKPNNSTISKMEQVEDKPKTQTKTQNSNLTFEKADEPQTDVYDYKGNGKWERSE